MSGPDRREAGDVFRGAVLRAGRSELALPDGDVVTAVADGILGPRRRDLERWTTLVQTGDVLGIQRVLTGLDRDSIEMREVSPMSGLLSPDERADALKQAG